MALSTGTLGAGPIASTTRRGGQRIQCKAIGRWTTQQEEGNKVHNTRQLGNRWWVGVMWQGQNRDNQIEAMMVVVGTVGRQLTVGGKGKGQDEWVVDDARQSGDRGYNRREGQTTRGK
jgi:hypothetical protein